MMKINIMKSKKSATSVTIFFAIIEIKNLNLDYTKKLEIIVILQENLGELFIAFQCIERKKFKSECEFIGFKNNRLNYRCKECNGRSVKSVNELTEKFPRMHKFCNGDLNIFVLSLRKGVYPNEYMDSWERFNETI